MTKVGAPGPDGGDLRIGLLGSLEITRSGVPVRVGGRKKRSLLALLALHPNQILSVDGILEDLWGDDPPRGASATVQSHVSHLRRDLGSGSGALVHQAPGYLLAVDPMSVDIGLFERDVGAALKLSSPREMSDSLAEALKLWRGPALAEFELAPWAMGEVARLDELRARAIESRIHADLALGRHVSLVAELEHLVTADPLRESRWTLLIVALQGAGRHVEALRAAQRFRSRLRDSGLTASPTFERIEHAVLNHEDLASVMPGNVAAAPEPVVTPSAGGGRGRMRPAAAGVPMVGREAEVAVLRSALDAADNGNRRLVVVTGEPGVGKTRLVGQVADEVEAAGGRVLVGHCDDGLEVPFQPFVDALGSFVEAEGANPHRMELALGNSPEELARLVPAISRVLPHLSVALGDDPDLERYRLFEAVASWLKTITTDGLALLVVEDLQWATRPTLLLLRHVLRSSGTARLCILATCRLAELEPRSECASLLADLMADVNASRLDLTGLDDRCVRDLIDRWQGTSDGSSVRLGPDVSSAVSTATGGNPFFVVEILRHLSETSGSGNGTASRIRTADLIPFPPNVNEVVQQRLHRLSSATEAMLTRAAVLGREFSVRALLAMGGLDEAVMVNALEQASRAGFIEPAGGADFGYRFCHALVQEVLVAGLSDVHRALTHRDAGLALERLVDAGADHSAVELARHFTAAAPVGEAVRAVRYSRAAGDQALQRHAADEAVAHYSTAVSLFHQCPNRDEHDRCKLMLNLGEALRRLPGDVHRDTFLEAAELARSLGDDDHLAWAAMGIARGFVLADEPDHGRIEVIETAVAAFGDRVDATPARLMASLAGERRLAGDLSLSEELMDQAVEMARRVGHIPTLVTTQLMRWDLVWHPGTFQARRSMAAELMTYIPAMGDPAPAVPRFGPASADQMVTYISSTDDSLLKTRIVAVNIVLALESGRGDEAMGLMSDMERHAAAVGGPFVAWAVPLMRSTLALAAGRLDDAERHTIEAADASPKDDPADAQAAVLGQLIHIRRLQGRLGECLTMLEPVADRLPAARALLARAWCEQGRHDEARAAFDQLFDGDELALPSDITWPVGVVMLAELCQQLGDARRAEQLTPLLLPYQDQFFASWWYFLGPVSYALGCLAATLGDVDDADGWFADAERRSRAFPAPLFAEQARAARLRLSATRT